MYFVNGEPFTSFLAAVDFAKKDRLEVFDCNGIRRWSPGEVPSDKKMREFLERKAAYEAQQRMKGQL